MLNTQSKTTQQLKLFMILMLLNESWQMEKGL